MVFIAKVVLALIVLAIAAQQLSNYYSIVIVGNYITNGSIGGIILTGVAWPLATLLIAGAALWGIIKFDPKSI